MDGSSTREMIILNSRQIKIYRSTPEGELGLNVIPGKARISFKEIHPNQNIDSRSAKTKSNPAWTRMHTQS
jgi:hypothetical protein